MQKDEAFSLRATIKELGVLKEGDPGSLFEVEYDEWAKVTSIWLATGNMVEDAALYGDLAVMDGTFGTNRHGWHLIAIAGVARDLKTVIFAIALIASATDTDFKRLLVL